MSDGGMNVNNYGMELAGAHGADGAHGAHGPSMAQHGPYFRGDVFANNDEFEHHGKHRWGKRSKRFSLGDTITSFFKGAVKGVIESFTTLPGLLMTGGAIALTALTGGAALPFIIAFGLVTSGVGMVRSVGQAIDAYGAGDVEGYYNCIENTGANTLGVVGSIFGARAAFKPRGMIQLEGKPQGSSSIGGYLSDLYSTVIGESKITKINGNAVGNRTAFEISADKVMEAPATIMEQVRSVTGKTSRPFGEHLTKQIDVLDQMIKKLEQDRKLSPDRAADFNTQIDKLTKLRKNMAENPMMADSVLELAKRNDTGLSQETLIDLYDTAAKDIGSNVGKARTTQSLEESVIADANKVQESMFKAYQEQQARLRKMQDEYNTLGDKKKTPAPDTTQQERFKALPKEIELLKQQTDHLYQVHEMLIKGELNPLQAKYLEFTIKENGFKFDQFNAIVSELKARNGVFFEKSGIQGRNTVINQQYQHNRIGRLLVEEQAKWAADSARGRASRGTITTPPGRLHTELAAKKQSLAQTGLSDAQKATLREEIAFLENEIKWMPDKIESLNAIQKGFEAGHLSAEEAMQLKFLVEQNVFKRPDFRFHSGGNAVTPGQMSTYTIKGGKLVIEGAPGKVANTQASPQNFNGLATDQSLAMYFTEEALAKEGGLSVYLNKMASQSVSKNGNSLICPITGKEVPAGQVVLESFRLLNENLGSLEPTMAKQLAASIVDGTTILDKAGIESLVKANKQWQEFNTQQSPATSEVKLFDFDAVKPTPDKGVPSENPFKLAMRKDMLPLVPGVAPGPEDEYNDYYGPY